ncbi:hypothetical protein KR018_000717 [Drosophila ironensis]|nr:hypothetical protein KR018_000717 [Drosophila ironensis]
MNEIRPIDAETAASKCRIETKVELETESRLTKKIRSGEIIFEDDFNGNQIDKGKWTHEERNLNTDTYDNQFVAFTAHNNYSRVENNKLKLTIIKLSIRKNHVFNNCTSTNKDPKIYAKECGKPKKNDSRIKRRVFPESDINGSGNIHTKGKFSFKYGRVEIRAKMPRGEFLFPNIFLQPVKYDVDYPMVPQIRLYARGNTVLQDVNRLDLSGKSLFGSVLIWKQEKEKRNYVPYEAFVTRTSPYHYSEDFYNYTIVWRKEKIVYMVDGVVVGTIANSQMLEDFNLHECYLVLGLIAGGRTNFDDDNIMEYHKRKIFSNEARGAKSGFYKAMKTFSWDQPSLLVDYIRVYAIDKNGY